MEERYHATTQNRFYPDTSNVNKNIRVEAKLIRPPTYIFIFHSANCLSLTLNPLTWKIWWAPNNASRWRMGFNSAFKALVISPRGRYDSVRCMITETHQTDHLTLNPLTWKIWWAPNNASRWRMGFNSAFKALVVSPRGRYDNVRYMITEPRQTDHLTINPLTWKIWWAPNNASRWRMGFNWAFKWLNNYMALQSSRLFPKRVNKRRK